MAFVFGIAVGLLAYVYAGYPALIWVLSRCCGKGVAKGSFTGGAAVLIAAHNEAEALPDKLRNLLELAKREPIREIWVGLDGCTDGTGERARAMDFPAIPAVHLVEFESRRGKAAVLNELMAKAGQPILVMMDARQRVEAGAVDRLLENFADPRVGVVSGELVYESVRAGAEKGAHSYWGYEKFIRRCESRFWAVPGATGALYAIRKELCEPIPENTLLDDVLIPMRAVMKGYRCLFEPAARVFDRPTDDYGRENVRKRRTLAGNWQLMGLEPRLFSVAGNPIFFQWVSHKALRLLTPLLLALAGAALVGLAWDGGWGWRAALGAGVVGVGTSWGAYWVGGRVRSRLFGLLGAFWGVNVALVRAAGDAWAGRYEPKWRK